MQCPKCGQEMPYHHGGSTQDGTRKVIYKRDVYHCAADDIWVSIETPDQSA